MLWRFPSFSSDSYFYLSLDYIIISNKFFFLSINKIESVYWLENKELKKGDIVIVYTKRQGASIKKIENNSGVTSFFLFWNLDTTLSNKQDKKVVCLETTWTTMKIENTDAIQQKEGN